MYLVALNLLVKKPTQLMVKPNSSSWHIIVTLTIPILVFEIDRIMNNTVCCLIALTCPFIFRVHPLLHCGARRQSKSKRNLVLAQEFQSGHQVRKYVPIYLTNIISQFTYFSRILNVHTFFFTNFFFFDDDITVYSNKDIPFAAI